MDRNGHLISEILNLQNLSCLLGEGSSSALMVGILILLVSISWSPLLFVHFGKCSETVVHLYIDYKLTIYYSPWKVSVRYR